MICLSLICYVSVIDSFDNHSPLSPPPLPPIMLFAVPLAVLLPRHNTLQRERTLVLTTSTQHNYLQTYKKYLLSGFLTIYQPSGVAPRALTIAKLSFNFNFNLVES